MGKQWKTAGKEVQASKKGALFTKLSREIQVAVRLAGPHLENNPRLKLALETARSHSLPKETIKRAISKGSGQKSDNQIEEVIYEGFGPHGVAMIVICLTENKTRTVSEVRYLFKKQKGSMEESGSVIWMFDRVALVQARKNKKADKKGLSQEEKEKKLSPTDLSFSLNNEAEQEKEQMSVEEEAILAGADDMEQEGDLYIFYGKQEELSTLRDNLIRQNWEVIKAEQAYKAKTQMTLNEEQIRDLQVLLKVFRENPDCKAVYTNLSSHL